MPIRKSGDQIMSESVKTDQLRCMEQSVTFSQEILELSFTYGYFLNLRLVKSSAASYNATSNTSKGRRIIV